MRRRRGPTGSGGSPGSRRLFFGSRGSPRPAPDAAASGRSPGASRSFSLATGSRRRPWGPRALANACNEPSRRARRQAVSCEEYRPSRRSKAPTSPGARQASASSRIRSFSCALKCRRLALSGTSGSGRGAALEGPPLRSGPSSDPCSARPLSVLIAHSPCRPPYNTKLGSESVSLYIGT